MTRHLPADAVIAVDVGNNTYSFGRYFECDRQSVLMSGYLGAIGFGYRAAMGAWCGPPERPDNGELGKISKEQRAGMWDVWATDLHNPGFAAYAELCGALGIRVTARDELEPALARALAHDGPSLVEVMQDAELV